MILMLNRWKNNWPFIIKDIFASIGFFSAIIGIISYFFPSLQKELQARLNLLYIFWCLLGICSLYGIFNNRPQNFCCEKIRDRDSWIELKIGDAFKNTGALIIPFNDCFDVKLNGNVKKANSIQNRLITTFYNSKEDHLENDISKKINLTEIPFPAGTIIEIEQKSKKFYLLVNSRKKKNNIVESNLDDFMLALNGLWDYLANDAGKDEAVTIPLLNSQHGRNPNLTRVVIVKQIIDTFIDASKYKSICEKLIISIYPSDLKKGELNFDELSQYLSFQCKNYKNIMFDSKPEGQETEPSIITDFKT